MGEAELGLGTIQILEFTPAISIFLFVFWVLYNLIGVLIC